LGSNVSKMLAYAVVADQIRTRILSGELRPGQRLPTEVELIDAHGFSRSTIREAIRSLASENLVHTTRGVTGGTFVSFPNIGSISTHLQNGVTLMAAAQEVSVDQLMDVRQLTEVPASGKAAHLRSETQLTNLRSSIDDPWGAASYEANQEFHLIILRAASNPMLELVTAPVFRVLGVRFARDRAHEAFWTSSDHDHREILAAIEARDSMTAMNLMRRHLDRLGDAYKAMDLLRDQDN